MADGVTSLRPWTPLRAERFDAFGGRRFRSILDYALGSTEGIRSALVDLGSEGRDGAGMDTLTYIDATGSTPIWSSADDVAVHVLWTSTTNRPVLRAGGVIGEPETLVEHACAPGDTLVVRAGTPFGIGEGILAVLIGAGQLMERVPPFLPVSAIDPLAPTHGLSLFHQFNRQTICAATPSLFLSRWKISQPLTLLLPPDRAVWISNLVTPVALGWPGGSDLLGRCESRVVPAGGGPITVIPDGLGYILVAWRPDLQRDVLEPLREAGYTRADIATVGIPMEWMG